VAAQTTGGEDPIDLFAKLMPVFSHSRCENCHGAVSPDSEVTHVGGNVGLAANCAQSNCHTQADQSNPDTRWQLAPARLTFVGKDTKTLCQMQAQEAERRRPPKTYMFHLENDFLIDLAFQGFSGGASNVAAPPAMSKDDFLAAAKSWLDDGGGLCGKWTGTITVTETFHTSYSYPIAVGKGPSTTAVLENATRTMRITLRNGQPTASSEMHGDKMVQMVMRDVLPSGPCTQTVTNNSSWHGTNSGDALVRVSLTSDGDYAIRFTGPAEKTESSESTVSTGNCSPGSSDPASAPEKLEWAPKRLTIRGTLADPRDRRHLKGDDSETLVLDNSRATKSKSWLQLSPLETARSDSGASLPIDVKTSWDLTLEE
jgi:hypothetical protein